MQLSRNIFNKIFRKILTKLKMMLNMISQVSGTFGAWLFAILLQEHVEIAILCLGEVEIGFRPKQISTQYFKNSISIQFWLQIDCVETCNPTFPLTKRPWNSIFILPWTKNVGYLVLRTKSSRYIESLRD